MFSLVPPEKRRKLYVATATSWKKHKPCHALSVPSCSVYAYKTNAMVDVDEEVKISGKRDVRLPVVDADRCFMVILQGLQQE